MQDWRDEKAKIYPLPVLLLAFLLTELAGLRRQRQRARWLHGNWKWILALCRENELIDKECGAPSQSTISRLCCHCDEDGLKQIYLLLMIEKSTVNVAPQEPIDLVHYSIDGKSRCGCVSEQTGRTEIDLVLLDLKARQALGWTVIPDKSGEATSALKLFDLYGRKLARGVLTADAAFASPKLLASVKKYGHEYVIGLKGNAGKVYDLVSSHDWSNTESRATTEDEAHGRHEIRCLEVLPISAFANKSAFSKYVDCRYVLRVTSYRAENGVSSIEVRYFIASGGLKGRDPQYFLALVRAHWQHENNFNWAKDAILGEDSLAKHSHRSSRLMGFLKSIVVSVAAKVCNSTQTFVDLMLSSPERVTRYLFASG